MHCVCRINWWAVRNQDVTDMHGLRSKSSANTTIFKLRYKIRHRLEKFVKYCSDGHKDFNSEVEETPHLFLFKIKGFI